MDLFDEEREAKFLSLRNQCEQELADLIKKYGLYIYNAAMANGCKVIAQHVPGDVGITFEELADSLLKASIAVAKMEGR